MGFPRQEYWSGLPFPSLGIFPTQGLNPDIATAFFIHSGKSTEWILQISHTLSSIHTKILLRFRASEKVLIPVSPTWVTVWGVGSPE